MFMNNIINMVWLKYLIFTESGTYYNIANHFGWVKLDTIDMEYQDLELATSPNDTITKLKYRGLYTWIFNSSNKSAQDLLAKESYKHHR